MTMRYWSWWLLRTWKVGAAVLLAAGVGLMVSLRPFVPFDHHGFVRATAKIDSFGTSPSSLRPGLIVVTASTPDGLIGAIVVPADKVDGCKTGDPIRADRKGGILYIYPEPCRPQ